MNLAFRIFIVCSVLLLCGMTLPAQQASYQSFLIDDFDTPNEELEWIVRGSKAVAEGFPRLAYVENWPRALHGFNKEEQEFRVLGVEAAFTQRGYNYVEILPAKRLQDGTVAPVPYHFPSTAVGFDLWVWGSYYNYTLEAHFRDYRGIVHVLRIGDTQFHGWENMSVGIPGGLRIRDVHDALDNKGLELMKLVLWTHPTEYSRNFFVYFDDLKVVTDGYPSVVDGSILADPDLRQDLWDEAAIR